MEGFLNLAVPDLSWHRDPDVSWVCKWSIWSCRQSSWSSYERIKDKLTV